MVIYDNTCKYKTKEIKIEPRIKLNYNISFEDFDLVCFNSAITVKSLKAFLISPF